MGASRLPGETLTDHSKLYFGRILLRRGWLVLATALIACGVAYLVAKRDTPIYQGRVEVLLRQSTGETDVSGAGTAGVSSVATELRIVDGYAVRQAVLKTLKEAVPIYAASMTSTSSFTITTRSADPQLAATSANTYAQTYIDQRRSGAVDDLLAVSQQIQARIVDLQSQLDAATGDVQRIALENQIVGYRTQLNDLQLRVSSVTPGAIILTPAQAPTSPIAPRPWRTAAEAGFGGLIVGIGLVLLMEYLDDTVTNDTLQRLSGTLPILGMIPTVPGWRDRNGPQVTALASPGSNTSEAFRSLRTSVRFLALDRPVKVIQVTSPTRRDGKTTTVANLAVVLAQAEERVVIVDFDLRRPRVHEFFGLTNDVGFTSVVLGDLSFPAAVQPVAGVAGLAVLTSGAPPPNPSEVLSSPRTAELIDSLCMSGWTVVLDSPPVMAVTDASVVSGLADATLLVTSARLTKKNDLKRTVDLLRQVRAPLVGTVLNRAGSKDGDYYAEGFASAVTATIAPTPEPRDRSASQPRPGIRVTSDLASHPVVSGFEGPARANRGSLPVTGSTDRGRRVPGWLRRLGRWAG